MRRFRRWLIGAVIAYLIVAAALVVIGLLAVRDARSGLPAARTEVSLARIENGRSANLRATGRLLDRAHRALGSPILFPVKLLPVVGRQVRSVDSLAHAGSRVLDVAADALDRGRHIAASRPTDGRARLDAVRDLQRIARSSRARLEGLDLGPSRNLFAPLARQRADFVEEINHIGDVLHRADLASAGLERFLRGPSRYAVMAANNAEMRAGSGMFLSAGVLEVKDGNLSLTGMKSVEEYPQPDGVALEQDFRALWGGQGPGAKFRFANMTPRFPTSGALVQRMWAAGGQPAIDGVLAIDPVTVTRLLQVLGPMKIEGTTVDARSSLKLFLHDQYVQFNRGTSQTVRRDFLGDATAAVFAALNRGGVSPTRLGTALGDSASGRHLMAWASDDTVQKGWIALGMDGRLPDSSLMFALQNRGANKLDYFQKVAATASVKESRQGSDVRIDFRITNTVPDGEPRYVAGPAEGLYVQEPNLYVGIASVNLPSVATDVRLDGGLYKLLDGPDGNTQVTSSWLHIPQGQTVTVRLTFSLPPGYNVLKILPSARIPGLRWEASGNKWTDDRARIVNW